MSQIKTGLWKEWLFLSRSLKFLGLALAFIIASLMNPVLTKLMLLMGDLYEDMPGMEDMGAMLTTFEGEGGLFYSYISTIGMFSMSFLPPMVLVIVMLLFGGACGGEQKKRSIILPQTMGLTPSGYVLPKFILFPTIVFMFTFLSLALTNVVCGLLLGYSYSSEIIITTGVLTSSSITFLLCLYMFFGISLAQPRMAIIYVLAANAVFPAINMIFNLDRFTPWSLEIMSAGIINNQLSGYDIYEGIGRGNVVITVIITLVLCLVLVGLTLFSIKAKQMDNTADEIY